MVNLAVAAIALAKSGALVFPCQPKGKAPITANGMLDASNDVELTAKRWQEHPGANIGIRPAVGVRVLDIDNRHGGDRMIDQLQEQYGALPATLAARTGNGCHLWFGLSGPTRSTLAEGVDCKGHNGYLIAPPSIHPTGVRYGWVNELPIAPAPKWVAELLAPRPAPTPRRFTDSSAGSSTRREQALLDTVLAAQPGQRNNVLFWAACRATEAGFDLNPLVQAAVSIGLTETEAFRTTASAAGRMVSA